jgi:predicted ATPase
MNTCECNQPHDRRRVVLTGCPGGGKTAILELIRRSFCPHVKVLPEDASVVVGGGFPRQDDPDYLCSAQRAIYHAQRELEVIGHHYGGAIVLCDRGTLDGLAYWPRPVDKFWSSLRTTLALELARYDAVIHLRTPATDHGYNYQNPLRTESASTAAAIDVRIADAWALHPRRFMVESTPDFLDKAIRHWSCNEPRCPTAASGTSYSRWACEHNDPSRAVRAAAVAHCQSPTPS